MANALVTVSNLHKVFKRGGERIDVLKGANLEIPAGDFLALMGPSGSGKTTLLNLLGGLDTPNGGAVEVDGVDVGSLNRGPLSRLPSPNIHLALHLYNPRPQPNAAK